MYYDVIVLVFNKENRFIMSLWLVFTKKVYYDVTEVFYKEKQSMTSLRYSDDNVFQVKRHKRTEEPELQNFLPL